METDLGKLFSEVDNVIREAAKADSPIARAVAVKKGVKALGAEPINVQFYNEAANEYDRPLYLRD